MLTKKYAADSPIEFLTQSFYEQLSSQRPSACVGIKYALWNLMFFSHEFRLQWDFSNRSFRYRSNRLFWFFVLNREFFQNVSSIVRTRAFNPSGLLIPIGENFENLTRSRNFVLTRRAINTSRESKYIASVVKIMTRQVFLLKKFPYCDNIFHVKDWLNLAEFISHSKKNNFLLFN